MELGTTLGTFEIISLLGKGGMGEVYRARDTKLGREVAIKVMPDEIASDAEYLQRFEREAVALAALNHSNVAGLHGSDEADGTHFLIMELVEGETLAERIEKGAVSVDDAIAIFIQIAEGLEAAHDRNIVHRDLKPANIKITPKGVVKILDFGMAKETGLKTPDTSSPDAPTKPISPSPGTLTTAGMILGTPNYMSPEQARGAPVDKRTDIWAFGCCLYQTLTREIPFQGATAMDVLSDVMKSDPKWERLPARVPQQVARLIRRCLEKDPDQRLHDIADARLNLQDARDNPEFVESPQASGRGISVFTALAIGVACLAIGVVLREAVLWQTVPETLRDGTSEYRQVRRFEMNLAPGEPLVSPSRFGRAIAISADGALVVYGSEKSANAQNTLYARKLSETEFQAVNGTDAARDPFMSPDGQWLGFYSLDESELRKVMVKGGPPATLCRVDSDPHGAVWTTDGWILFSNASADAGPGLWRIREGGGTPERLTIPDATKGESSHEWPSLLPDELGVLFTVYYSDVRAPPRAAVLDIASKAYRILDVEGTNPRYANSGHLIVASGRKLVATAFDLHARSVGTSSAAVLDGVQTSQNGRADYVISRDGLLVYALSGTAARLRSNLAWVHQNGKTEVLEHIDPQRFESVVISPDGSRMVTVVHDDVNESGSDVWVYHLETGARQRLTFGENASNALWMPDGEQIVLNLNLPGRTFDVYRMPSDGSEQPQLVFEDPRTSLLHAVEPSGQRVAISQFTRDGSMDILLVDLTGDKSPTVFVDSEFQEESPAFSPDGKWLAYGSYESGREEIFVRPVSGDGGKWQISSEGANVARWSLDGRTLYYSRDDEIYAVDVNAQNGFRSGTPRLHFKGMLDDNALVEFSFHPDGRMLIRLAAEEGEQRRQFNVIENWTEELKRLVPVPGAN